MARIIDKILARRKKRQNVTSSAPPPSSSTSTTAISQINTNNNQTGTNTIPNPTNTTTINNDENNNEIISSQQQQMTTQDDLNHSNNNNNKTTNNNTNNNDNNIQQFPQGYYYSLEFFPPKTEQGLDNLLLRIERMVTKLDPLFIDITWGEAGSTSARTLALASHAQRYCGVDVLLHLTCTGLTREQIASILGQAKSCGVHNILALRGDPPRGKRLWNVGDVSGGDCSYAIDLIKLIRDLYGDYFGIAVAGHPEGHSASRNVEEEMEWLHAKMEAGADFIITQFFYDVNVYLDYVQTCRAYGIHCPILPGILPIQSYGNLVRMTEYCSISVPEDVMVRVEKVKEDDEAVKQIGLEIAVDMARRILSLGEEGGGNDGVHFYTLNLERSVTQILMSLGAVEDPFSSSINDSDANGDAMNGTITKTKTSQDATTLVPSSRRALPWRPSALESRIKEDVRPIHWANRPKSYVMRTDDWDEFPNGRWGDSSSPAFGELSDLSHFYSFHCGSEDDRLAILGYEPKAPQDVYNVFANYVEGKIPHLPWCESALQPESFPIQQTLAKLNRLGILTVNSQPSVNGVPSTDPMYGWGGSGGYVYQKAYCECFVSPAIAQKLMNMVQYHHGDQQSSQPNKNTSTTVTTTTRSLYAVNKMGHELRVGMEEGAGPTALTWGVFPGREIIQPTIYDPNTFLVWAEEAFSLWSSMWLNLYDFDSVSYELIENIRDTYYLVAIIENDYILDSAGGGLLWKDMLRVGEE